MDRLEQLRHVIDDIVRNNPDPEESRCGFVHLYGVSAICVILAVKRGLDPELCSTSGILHDIWNYKFGDHPNHDQLGAIEARKILSTLGTYAPDEINAICEAISTHGDKISVHGEMAELLKDADVFQHYIYNPQLFETDYSHVLEERNQKKMKSLQRLERVLREFGTSPAKIEAILSSFRSTS